MSIEELTDIALKAGEILLRSGAEIYRVEDTIIKIIESRGFTCDCFVLLTGIFISVRGNNNEGITQIKRIKGHSFDLSKIEQTNSFSRMVTTNKSITYTEAISMIGNILLQSEYSSLIKLIAAGFTAFAYTLIFRGTFYEGISATIVGITIFIFRNKIGKIGFFPFFETFVSGIIAAFMCVLAVSIIQGMSIYRILIGGIMILLPGMSITNSIKDALNGDVVSSIYRLAEAIFAVIAVGVGVGIAFTIGLR